jgi:hypothetical protein
MIAEETCASHALSSAKIMADFAEPSFNPGRNEARGSIEDPVPKDGARPSTAPVTRTKRQFPLFAGSSKRLFAVRAASAAFAAAARCRFPRRKSKAALLAPHRRGPAQG